MSKRVPVTLSDEEHGMLERLAREMGVSMAGWVRVAVRSAARETSARAPADTLAAARGDAGA